MEQTSPYFYLALSHDGTTSLNCWLPIAAIRDHPTDNPIHSFLLFIAISAKPTFVVTITTPLNLPFSSGPLIRKTHATALCFQVLQGECQFLPRNPRINHLHPNARYYRPVDTAERVALRACTDGLDGHILQRAANANSLFGVYCPGNKEKEKKGKKYGQIEKTPVP